MCKMNENDKIWEVVNEQREINTKERIDWTPILKMSLSKATARFKAAGLTPEQTYNAICFEHPELDTEAKRKMWIGINARCGEMNSEQKELNKPKHNLSEEITELKKEVSELKEKLNVVTKEKEYYKEELKNK